MSLTEELVIAENEFRVASEYLADASQRERLARLRVMELRSKKFIADHGIRRADVQIPGEPGTPDFMVASEFVKWIACQSHRKRWVVWNGVLHHTTDFLMGRSAGTDGRLDDVPE